MQSPPKYTYAWFIERFEYAQHHARQIAFSIDEDTFLRQPAPEKWSPAECLQHLVEFGNIYHATIGRGLEQAAIDTALPNAVFEPRFFWKGIIRLFEPPYKMKLKTISSFKPQKVEQSRQDICDNFSSLQKRFVDQLKRSRQKGIDISAQKMGNPALPFLKMRLSECYAVAEAHQRRHLWQAKQTIKKMEQANH